MKCRKLVRASDGHYDVCFFGYGSKNKDKKVKLTLTNNEEEVIANNTDIYTSSLTTFISGITYYELNENGIYVETEDTEPNENKMYYIEDENNNKVLATEQFTSFDEKTAYYSSLSEYIDTSNILYNLYYKNDDDDLVEISKIENSDYAEGAEAVVYSLIQRLSVLKGELWYNKGYGLSLLEKVRNKNFIDGEIINIILSHPEVRSIINYESKISNDGGYRIKVQILTIYNTNEEIETSVGL